LRFLNSYRCQKVQCNAATISIFDLRATSRPAVHSGKGGRSDEKVILDFGTGPGGRFAPIDAPRSASGVGCLRHGAPSGNYEGSGIQIFTFLGPTGVSTGYCEFTGTAILSGGPNDPVGTTGTITVTFTLRCNGDLQPPQTASTTYTIIGTNEFGYRPLSWRPKWSNSWPDSRRRRCLDR
jgi:hypothetical protein